MYASGIFNAYCQDWRMFRRMGNGKSGLFTESESAHK